MILHGFADNSSVLRLSTISSSSCKKLQSHLFISFNFNSLFPNKPTKILHAQKTTNSIDNEVLVGFKPEFHCKIVSLSKNKTSKGRNSKYGGILPSILKRLESESDVEKALDLYHGKLTPKEQTVILKEQRKWYKALKVFDCFKLQKDYVPNVIHYNVVLRTLGRAQKWDELRICWIEMAKNGVLPTNNTYGMLVDVYGKAGLVKEALLWIKHMKLRGVFPDEVTMSTVIKVLKDGGEYDRADKFYKDWRVGKIELDYLELDNIDEMEPVSLKQFLSTELFRTGGRMNSVNDSDSSRVVSTAKKLRLATTYNTLIDLYGKAGKLKDAADVFAEMLNSGVAPDTFTFNTMIYICGSKGSLTEAEALLEKMEERGLSPDTKTYNIFMSLYANVGKIEGVLECYRKIREIGLFPDEVTHRAVIKILCERNMVGEVEAVLKDLEKFETRMDENSLPVLVKMYVNGGLTERAKSLVEKFPSCYELSSRTRAAIIDVYAEKGLWAEAESLFYCKKDGSQEMDIMECNVMIKAYGISKQYDKAISLFNSMRNQGTWPDDCTYNSFIQMLAGGDLVEKARDFLTDMQEAGFKPSCSTFSAIIVGFAKKNRLSDAVEVFEEMSRTDVKPNEVVFGLLINAFAETGDFTEAIRYFRAMEDYGVKANGVILTSMIKAYGKIGSVEGAKQMYEKMKKLGGGPDIVASNSMLSLYADLGMVSEAEVMYKYLREKNYADGVTFATMMHVYRNMGMLEEAIEVAAEMKKTGLVTDSVTYNKVMACYSASGQLLECGELLHEMVVSKKLIPDKGTFKVLFTILKKGGHPDEAIKQLETSYLEGKPFSKQAVITSVFSVVGLHSYALASCGILTKEDVSFNSFAYNAAIRAYVAYGKTDEALNMFMKMQDEGLEPDIVTLINLVNCYGKAGMIEGVKRIYSQLKYGAIAPNEALYKAVIEAYKNANRSDLAELVSQELKFAFEEKNSENVSGDEYEPDDPLYFSE